MKLNELLEANIKIHSLLEVRSAYNGKVLCRNFDRKKHIEIGERELVSLWASTKKQGDDPGGWIYPVLCCYVDGRSEYEKEAVDGEQAH